MRHDTITPDQVTAVIICVFLFKFCRILFDYAENAQIFNFTFPILTSFVNDVTVLVRLY